MSFVFREQRGFESLEWPSAPSESGPCHHPIRAHSLWQAQEAGEKSLPPVSSLEKWGSGCHWLRPRRDKAAPGRHDLTRSPDTTGGRLTPDGLVPTSALGHQKFPCLLPRFPLTPESAWAPGGQARELARAPCCPLPLLCPRFGANHGVMPTGRGQPVPWSSKTRKGAASKAEPLTTPPAKNPQQHGGPTVPTPAGQGNPPPAHPDSRVPMQSPSEVAPEPVTRSSSALPSRQ